MDQRKFTMGALRELGMGKNKLQDKIMEEVYHLTEAFKEKRGQVKTCLEHRIMSACFSSPPSFANSHFHCYVHICRNVDWLLRCLDKSIFRIALVLLSVYVCVCI